VNQFTINQLHQKGPLQLLTLDATERLVLLQAFFKGCKEFGLTDLLIIDSDQRWHLFNNRLRIASGNKAEETEEKD